MSSELTGTAMSASDDLLDTEAGPDIAEDEFRAASEVFKDPSSFDFLSQHGSGTSTASQLARESLYVKFDPLIGGRPSIMPNHRASNVNGNDTTKDLIAMNSPSPKKPSNPNLESNGNHVERPNSTDTTGTPPSESDSDVPKKGSPSSTGPAPASPPALQTLSPEQQLQFQEQVLKKETQIADLNQIIEEKLQTIDKLRTEAKKRRESEDQMKQVLNEYEKTISELIAEKEKEKHRFDEDRQLLQMERDQAAEDLKNVESAFADVHRKYERTKQVVEGFKQNEETLKKCVEEYAVKLRKQDHKYELLKAHAEETLEQANREIENISKTQEADMARLTAMLKKTEMKTAGLERALDQKTKENSELTSICDELIAKMGSS